VVESLAGPADDDFHFGLVLGDGVGREEAAPEDVGVNHGAAAEDAAGVQDGVAAGFGVVAEEGAKLAQAGVKGGAIFFDGDIAGEELDVGDFHAGANMGLMAENGVADVIVMGHLGAVEEEGVLEFAGVAHDAVVADEDVFTEVGVVADLAVFTNDGRAFDHGAGFDDGAGANEDARADGGAGKAGGRVLPGDAGEVGLDFFEGVPGVGAVVEEGGMFGLCKVEKVSRFEHGGRLGERAGAEKGNAAARPGTGWRKDSAPLCLTIPWESAETASAMKFKDWFAWVCLALMLVAEFSLFRANHTRDVAVTELQAVRQELQETQTERDDLKNSSAGQQAAEIARLRKQNEILTGKVGAVQKNLEQLQAEYNKATQHLTTARTAIQLQQEHLQQLQTETQPPALPDNVATCLNNLRVIDAAKQQWAQEKVKTAEDVPTVLDLQPYFKDRTFPFCPDGGSYTINAVSVVPTCSIPAHSLAQ